MPRCARASAVLLKSQSVNVNEIRIRRVCFSRLHRSLRTPRSYGHAAGSSTRWLASDKEGGCSGGGAEAGLLKKLLALSYINSREMYKRDASPSHVATIDFLSCVLLWERYTPHPPSQSPFSHPSPFLVLVLGSHKLAKDFQAAITPDML